MITRHTCAVRHKDFEPRRQLEPKGVTDDIEAIAYELEAVRDVVTSMVMMQNRPHQPCTGLNKHFFALEFLESQFMVAFLQEIQKRNRCVSLIWLHDGLWVHKDLSNSLLLSCEQIAAQKVFPTLPEWPSLFRIQEVSDQEVFVSRCVSPGVDTSSHPLLTLLLLASPHNTLNLD